ncbi:hypothetical protein R9D69_001225 [Pseudomonas aeruginosa]|nr:hypothetical protein [Pseudomonas aeruginosa]HCT4810693.1 hypothetical protein [Pseudomonas aeruginosa]
MISADQAASILRALSPSRFEIVDGIFRCQIAGVNVSVPVAEFEEYQKIKALPNQLTDTSLYTAGYFEHAIELQGRGPNSYRLFRDSDEITLKHEQTGFVVEISPISTKFLMFLTDTDTMHRDFRRLSMMRRPILRGKEEVLLADLFARILSIKVFAPENHQLFSSSKQLRSIADASLYNVSYGYGVALVPVKSWERSLHFLEGRRREAVQFPLRTYNHELVAYYQMALGGESLILSYLALYKILEYFFTAASEHLLHQKIVEHLVAPDFSHTKVGKLRELAKVVRKFDQKIDERRMLQTVFEQHIDKEALRLWIEGFDKENSGYFSIERELFGEPSRIDTSDNQIFPTVGARIYHIRNALVHNKEGEISRFIPFSGQEKILAKEAPLLRRISEELILKSGKDIQL